MVTTKPSRPLLAVLSLLGSSIAQTDPLEYAKTVTNGEGSPLIQLGDTYTSQEKGEAILTIMSGEQDVQKSNYDWRSCQIENTGTKRIAAVYINVKNAIFPDMVFDDNGSGGDDVAKELTHDWGTTETNPIAISEYEWRWDAARGGSFDPTASFDPSDLLNVDNLFVNELSDSGLGGAGGYRGALILFKDFDGGETYEFSADMDPNSIAGLTQGTAAIDAEWDVGGVSGAELTGSVVTVLFGDGSTATGTISPDGSQAGSIAVVGDTLLAAPGLSVGSLGPGGSGTYSSSETVVVNSTPGTTVRVTMFQGFDPVDNQTPLAGGKIVAEALVTARLVGQYPEFPVNNARRLQHAEVLIPSSGSVDVTSMFQFIGQDALGFTAVAIDSVGKWPVSETTTPIHLVFGGSTVTCPSNRPKLDGSGYCVEQSCNDDYQCPFGRKPDRFCYNTESDCLREPNNCPSNRPKLDGSGFCVEEVCNDNYQCPFGRKPDRFCYNNANDCLPEPNNCPSNRPKLDGSGYCVESSCNDDYQCPFGRKPDRFCYNTASDCMSGSNNNCPSERPKLDGSGYCVSGNCNANYQCPSGRKPDRFCYDTSGDCL